MSRSPSPTQSTFSQDDDEGGPGAAAYAVGGVIPCQWGDGCPATFNNADELGDHVNNVHVIEDRPKYTCKWRTCERRGLPQASKFALIVHCRSHTGQRPFICDQGDCTKTFTRADALHKHQRAHHGMDIPMPGRGGNRKRKYTTRDQEVKNAQAAAAAGQHQHQQHHHREHHRDRDENGRPSGPPLAPGTQPARAIPPPGQERERRLSDIPRASGSGSRSHPPLHPPFSGTAGVPLSAPPGRPPSQEGPAAHHPPPEEAIIASQNSPDVGPYKAAYLIEKSKLRFVTIEQQGLLDELDRFQREESTAYFEKERVLDKVLKANFGSAAADLLSRHLQAQR